MRNVRTNQNDRSLTSENKEAMTGTQSTTGDGLGWEHFRVAQSTEHFRCTEQSDPQARRMRDSGQGQAEGRSRGTSEAEAGECRDLQALGGGSCSVEGSGLLCGVVSVAREQQSPSGRGSS